MSEEKVAHSVDDTVNDDEDIVNDSQLTSDSLSDKALEKALEHSSCREIFKSFMMDAEEKLCLRPFEKNNVWDKDSPLERVIHYMRWNPEYLTDCGLEELHEYEMCLAAHVVFVQSKENHWRAMCDISKRDTQQKKKLAASKCKGNSVGEREALAMELFPSLKRAAHMHDVYKMYMEKCESMAEAFMQMDNSLKKLLATRSNEYRYGSN
jgi:hypothetical protein